MCQGKKEGGRRCAIHMKGSNAACLHAERSTGANKKEVKEAFKDLRREGKELELPAPPPEVVKAFAEMQRFSANFDPELTEHDRKIITNAWNRTSNAVEQGETPDGATFHAWQNLRSEVMRRLAMQKSRLMAIGISGALSLGISACSAMGGQETAPDPNTSPTVSAPVSPAPTPSQTSSPTPSPSPTSIADAFGIAATGETLTDVHGEWQRAELTEDAPVMQLDTNKYRKEVWDYYSEEEVEEAQELMAKFLVSNYLDGPSAFDHSDAALRQQWDDIKGKIHMSAKEDMQNAALSTSPAGGVNLPTSILIQPDRNYAPAPYKPGKTRFTTDGFELNEGYLTENKNLGLNFQTDYTHELVKDGQTFTAIVKATYQANVTRENGIWQIAGWRIDGKLEVFDAAGNLVDSA